jgi:hypothetical protein
MIKVEPEEGQQVEQARFEMEEESQVEVGMIDERANDETIKTPDTETVDL